MQPILTSKIYEQNNVIVQKGKTFSKLMTTENNKDPWTYVNSLYEVSYKYTQDLTNKLCCITDYLPIKQVGYTYRNKFNSSVNIAFVISEENLEHLEFKNMMCSIFNEIQKKILLENPTATFDIPYDEEKKRFSLHLKSINRTDKHHNTNLKIYYNVCPVFFHESKSKGGNLLEFNNDEVYKTCADINAVMPMLKSNLYMKQTDSKFKNIYYVGKFIFEINVELSTYSLYNNIKTVCKIFLIATEVEIKNNMSFCQSVLSKELTSVNIQKNKISSIEI